METKGALFFARPHATRRVARSDTTAPNIDRLDAERRVRTPEAARTNAASGAITSRGTAHPRVVNGSNVKPRGPVAAPDAAAAMSKTAASRLNQNPPGQPARRPAPPMRCGRPTVEPRTPGRAAASRPPAKPRSGRRPRTPFLRPRT